MKLFKAAAFALSVMALVGISVTISSAAQAPDLTPTPATGSVTAIPTQFDTDYMYKVTDADAKECEIIYYRGSSSSELIVPSKIGGYTVKTIGSGAYREKNITSVQIPLSVDYVDYCAFGNCQNLKSVMILNKNIRIHEDAFKGSNKIDTIIYPGTYAEAEALVEKVNLPEGVKINLISYPSPTMSITQAPEPTEAEVTEAPKPTIAEATETPVPTVIVSATPAPSATETPVPTFIVSATPAPSATVTATVTPTAAPSVTVTATPAPSVTVTATPTPTVTVAAKPASTAKVGGNTYKIKGKEITVTAVSAKASKVVIPSTVKINGKKYKVTSVSAAAFKKNKSLTSVTIGKNITSIAKNAFKGKAGLAKITVKSTALKKIGKGAFSGIAKKVTIVIPKKKAKAYKKLFDKAVKAKITYKTV